MLGTINFQFSKDRSSINTPNITYSINSLFYQKLTEMLIFAHFSLIFNCFVWGRGGYGLFLVVFTVFHHIAYSSSDLGCSKRSFFCFHPPTSTTTSKDLGCSKQDWDTFQNINTPTSSTSRGVKRLGKVSKCCLLPPKSLLLCILT